jgi:hypothetical protein
VPPLVFLLLLTLFCVLSFSCSVLAAGGNSILSCGLDSPPPDFPSFCKIFFGLGLRFFSFTCACRARFWASPGRTSLGSLVLLLDIWLPRQRSSVRCWIFRSPRFTGLRPRPRSLRISHRHRCLSGQLASLLTVAFDSLKRI